MSAKYGPFIPPKYFTTADVAIGARASVLTTTTRTVNTYADPSVETGIPASRGDIPIPILIGRRLITNFNTIWVDTPRTRVEVVRKEPATVLTYTQRAAGLASFITVTAKFLNKNELEEYYAENPDKLQVTTTVKTTVNFAIGLCLGPGTRLHRIEDESGNIIWSSALGAQGATQISVPSFCERIHFYPGDFNQPVNALMASIEGSAFTPAYRGVCYMVVQGAYISNDMAPIDGMGFEVSRAVNPLGLASQYVQNDVYDQNIANAVVEILTNPWTGANLPMTYIDVPTFTACAQKLAVEDNWCSVLVSTKARAASVVAGLLQQADASLRWNPAKAKYEMVLNREDFDVAQLPSFGVGNMAVINDFGKPQWRDLPKIVTVSYIDRANRYTEASAGIKVNEHVNEYSTTPLTVTLGSVVTSQVAAKVLPQIVARSVSPLLSGGIETGRDAEALLPGDVIKVTWPDIPGLVDLPMRIINKREAGELKDTYTLTVEQAVLPAKNTKRPIPNRLSSVTNQNINPPGEAYITTLSLPMMFLKQNGGTYLDGAGETSATLFIPAFMIETDSAPSYNVTGYNAPEYVERTFADMATSPIVGTLTAAIDADDGYVDGWINITLTVPEKPPSATRETNGWLIIGDEIMQYTSVLGDAPNVELLSCHRGLVDTVPTAHASGAKVYILPNFSMVSKFALPGDAVSLSFYGTAGFRISDQWTDVEVTGADNTRATRPACPQNGQITIDGVPLVSRDPNPTVNLGNDYYVTWAERNRHAKRTIYLGEPSQPMDETTTYTVTLISMGDVSSVLATGVSGDSVQVTIPAGLTTGAARIEIKSTNVNGDSINVETITLTLA